MSALTRTPLRQLSLLALASLAGYLIVWGWFPLRPYFNILPLQDVRSLAPSLLAGLGYGLLLLALFGLYWLAFRLVQAGKARPSLWFLGNGRTPGPAPAANLPHQRQRSVPLRHSRARQQRLRAKPVRRPAQRLPRRSVPAAGGRVGGRNVALRPAVGTAGGGHHAHYPG
ncbi:MAG: hypothetical protein IPJ90_00830 [Anaerolineaceae bacterium]|nr:hypothetical protein [Anaerolineaceae bacterium]